MGKKDRYEAGKHNESLAPRTLLGLGYAHPTLNNEQWSKTLLPIMTPNVGSFYSKGTYQGEGKSGLSWLRVQGQ